MPAVVLAIALAAWQPAHAQTYTVLHSFTNSQDGSVPWGGLTMDAAGNLYGTASYGGSSNCMGGCGTVFKLSQRNSSWTFTPLYEFNGAPDGAYPEGRLIFGRDGRLYGTTGRGGSQAEPCGSDGCGTVFAMRPPASFCQSVLCYWSEQVLYQFSGNDDGKRPAGDTVFDSAGNFYGTAYAGGSSGLGSVYELSPSGGGWNFSVLHAFAGSDGANPYGGLTFDNAGNLYGTTQFGGAVSQGTVFQLANSGSGWVEAVLHSFNGGDGDQPLGGVVLDSSGNIYGTTNRGGFSGIGGKVFGLSPSGNNWVLSVLYSFTGRSGPWGDLIVDSAGNIYGTTLLDGANNFGSVFKMTFSGGTWTYTTLHDFNGQDGGNPHGAIVLDSNGNLYGVGAAGGPRNLGVVWEITP